MNLHGIVSGKVAAVNPLQPVILQVCIEGYVTNPDGSRVPAYLPPVTVTAQVQDLSTRDLRQLDALNIQGSMKSIYLNGTVDAISRLNAKGGDLLTLKDGTIWLTTSVLEQWPDWVKVSVTVQNSPKVFSLDSSSLTGPDTLT